MPVGGLGNDPSVSSMGALSRIGTSIKTAFSNLIKSFSFSSKNSVSAELDGKAYLQQPIPTMGSSPNSRTMQFPQTPPQARAASTTATSQTTRTEEVIHKELFDGNRAKIIDLKKKIASEGNDGKFTSELFTADKQLKDCEKLTGQMNVGIYPELDVCEKLIDQMSRNAYPKFTYDRYDGEVKITE